MSDLISRQAAIDAMEQAKEQYFDRRVIIGKMQDIVNNLPSAQPKRGKWVFKTVFPNDTSEFPMGYLVCSECGSKHPNKTPCNFCDNCGADMRGKQDDSYNNVGGGVNCRCNRN